MAQTRSSLRTYNTMTSPPCSPPRLYEKEKKHHSRRKSGKDYVVSSDKKSSRPAAPLSRKTTPQYNSTKTSSAARRDVEREEEEERRRGRDSGESFPMFCMTCEKQFLPADNTFLYCSETCRLRDQSAPPRSASFPTHNSPPLSPYSRHFPSSASAYAMPSCEEGPDIIPRFSPTQSRPRSYFNSDPYPSTSTSHSTYTTLSSSPHTTNQSHRAQSSSALESLRELATALPPKTSSRRDRDRDRGEKVRGERIRDPESPPKSSASSISRSGSGVWDYIPFTSSGFKTSTPTPSATPGSSYTNQYNHQYNVSQSYSGYGGGGGNGYGKSDYTATTKIGGGKGGVNGAGYTTTGGMGMDRPLPPRSGPGGYGHRPRSIDLVTPFGGH